MGTFLAETAELESHGGKIIDLAGDFGYAHKKINETVKAIVEAYPSESGRDIATKIDSYDATLNAMEEKLRGHGEWSRYSGRTTNTVSSDISSEIANKL